jgi:predicted RNA-binding Zn-ribbon protein involved in translation (DUF1610 family)
MEVNRQVAVNVALFRHRRRLSVRALSARLTELGHPIGGPAITKIEGMYRRVTVADLMALAAAFGISPMALLYPAKFVDREYIDLPKENREADVRSPVAGHDHAHDGPGRNALPEGADVTRFACPRCGATSSGPEDISEGYCGRCHEWTGPDQRRTRGICPRCGRDCRLRASGTIGVHNRLTTQGYTIGPCSGIDQPPAAPVDEPDQKEAHED